MGRHRAPLRAAGRGGRGRRPARDRQRRLAAGVPGVALGQVRLHGRPGPAARRPRALRRLLPAGGGRADPARGIGAHPLPGHPAGRLSARSGGPGQRPGGTPARRDHGPRPRLDQGGAAGHGRVPAGPGDGHARDRRPRPGRGRLRPPDRAGLREGRHRRRRLPGHPGRRRWRQRRAVRHQPRRLLRRPRRRPRETASGGCRPGRTVPARPGLGRAARADQGHLPSPVRRRQRRRGAGQGRDPHPGGGGRRNHHPAAHPRRRPRPASPPPTTRNAWPARSPRPSW